MSPQLSRDKAESTSREGYWLAASNPEPQRPRQSSFLFPAVPWGTSLDPQGFEAGKVLIPDRALTTEYHSVFNSNAQPPRRCGWLETISNDKDDGFFRYKQAMGRLPLQHDTLYR